MKVKLRPVVAWFAEQMELKLRENDYKGGWQDETPSYFWQRLLDEKKELACEMRKPDKSGVPREAVDVGNFAMMLADSCAPGTRDQAPPDPDEEDINAKLRGLLARLHRDGGQRQAKEEIADEDLFRALDVAATELLSEANLPELALDERSPFPLMVPKLCRLPQFGNAVVKAGDRITFDQVPGQTKPTFFVNGRPLKPAPSPASSAFDDLEKRINLLEDNVRRGYWTNAAFDGVHVIRALIPLLKKAIHQ